MVIDHRIFRLLAAATYSCLFVCGAAFAQETAQRVWTGSMEAGGRVFRFRVEPLSISEDSHRYQLVSADEGGRIFLLDSFELTNEQLRFELKASKAAYTGQISADRATATGKWKQNAAEFDLIFQKSAAAPEDRPSEIWSGTLQSLFQKLEIQVRVYRAEDGTERLYFDSVTQKSGGFKASRIMNGQEWTIEVQSLGGTFKGVLSEDRQRVVGTWTQNGINMDLTLTRGAVQLSDTVAAPVRPQTPREPVPYLIEEVSFENPTASVRLAGTLTIPSSDQPVPAVILITGSGPQDRDETLLDHKPFWVIADYLSRHGIAVLRYDDRGVGKSTGDFSTSTSQDLADDAEAAFDYLQQDSRIRRDQTGFLGHSEGGMIAPMVASKRAEAAFAILLAGSAVNGREILLSQGQLIMKAAGVTDPDALARQRNMQLAIIDSVLAATPDTKEEEVVNETLRRLRSSLSDDELSNESLITAVRAGVHTMNGPWFRYFLTHEPGPVLEQVRCPVLALNGEKDVQVDPDLNLPAIRRALEKSGNRRFEVREIPGLNHLFQTCENGGLSEYQSIEQTISPEVLETVTRWIQEIVAGP